MAVSWTYRGQGRSKPDDEFVRTVQQAVGSNIDGRWGQDTSRKLAAIMAARNLPNSAAQVQAEAAAGRVGPATLRAGAYALTVGSSQWNEGDIANVAITQPGSVTWVGPAGLGGNTLDPGKNSGSSSGSTGGASSGSPSRGSSGGGASMPLGMVPTTPTSTSWPWYYYAGIVGGAALLVGGGVYAYAKYKNDEEDEEMGGGGYRQLGSGY